jgi:predicted MFS family arabinose efflux permease
MPTTVLAQRLVLSLSCAVGRARPNSPLMPAASQSPLRFAFAGMIGMAVAMGIGRFVYTPMLPGMMQELRLSPTEAGWIASANYLGYLLGAFAAAGAWAAGRERSLMLAGLLSSALLAAAMAATENLTAFLTIRFLAGVASAFVMIFLASIVFGRLNRAGRPDLQALHFAGVGVGIAISSLMMAGLVTVDAHWPAGWIWSAVMSVAGLLCVWMLINGSGASKTAEQREPALPKSGALWRLIVAYGLFGFGYVVTATFLIAIVRQEQGSRLFETAVWLVAGVAAAPSVFAWATVARRFGPAIAFMTTCLVEAVGVAASVSLGGVGGPLLGATLLGGTFVAATAYGLRAAALLAPEAPRRVFALMTGFFGVGQIIGPMIAGLLAHQTGSYFAASMAASAALVVAAAIAAPRRTAA